MKCDVCGHGEFSQTTSYPRTGRPVGVTYCEKCGEVQAVDPL